MWVKTRTPSLIHLESGAAVHQKGDALEYRAPQGEVFTLGEYESPKEARERLNALGQVLKAHLVERLNPGATPPT